MGGETAEGDGIGETDDGQVHAVARAGRLVSLEVTARVMRRDPAEIGSSVRHAVNAALDHEQHLVSGRLSGLPGPDVVARVLSESRAELAAVASDRFPAGARTALLAEALDIVAEVGRLGPDGGGPSAGHGIGSDGDLRVVAVAGRVDAVEVSVRATQWQSREFAGRVLTCVNSALDDAARDAATDSGGTTDTRALGDRIATLREEWVRHVSEQAARAEERAARLTDLEEHLGDRAEPPHA